MYVPGAPRKVPPVQAGSFTSPRFGMTTAAGASNGSVATDRRRWTVDAYKYTMTDENGRDLVASIYLGLDPDSEQKLISWWSGGAPTVD